LETSTPKNINRKAKYIKSLWKLVHQRASTGKPNKSKAFGNFLLMLFGVLVSKGF
jgi:hypothetical protein